MSQEPFEWEKNCTYTRPFISGSKVRAIVWDKTDPPGRCWYCGKQTNPWKDFCIDHIIPGIDEITNVVPCCHKCNIRKGNQGIEHLRQVFVEKEGLARMSFYFELRGFLASG